MKIPRYGGYKSGEKATSGCIPGSTTVSPFLLNLGVGKNQKKIMLRAFFLTYVSYKRFPSVAGLPNLYCDRSIVYVH